MESILFHLLSPTPGSSLESQDLLWKEYGRRLAAPKLQSLSYRGDHLELFKTKRLFGFDRADR
jgi:hypothetical protein